MNEEEKDELELEEVCRYLAKRNDLQIHQVVARLMEAKLIEEWHADAVFIAFWKRPLDDD